MSLIRIQWNIHMYGYIHSMTQVCYQHMDISMDISTDIIIISTPTLVKSIYP